MSNIVAMMRFSFIYYVMFMFCSKPLDADLPDARQTGLSVSCWSFTKIRPTGGATESNMHNQGTAKM